MNRKGTDVHYEKFPQCQCYSQASSKPQKAQSVRSVGIGNLNTQAKSNRTQQQAEEAAV